MFRLVYQFRGEGNEIYFTKAERETALAVAQEMHDAGRQVRVNEYGGKFRCVFDSKQRARRRTLVRKAA